MIDTIRDTLVVIEIAGIKYILINIVKKAIENKVFDNATFDWYAVASIHGTNYLEALIIIFLI